MINTQNKELSSLFNNDNYILCYTREPLEDKIYAPKLAYSMHLAFSHNGEDFQALNHNSGVLFAKATVNEDGTLIAKSLKNPYLFILADGTFGVVAIRTEANGENDEQSKGKLLFFTSTDLLQYTEIGLIDLKSNTFVEDVRCQLDETVKEYMLSWRDEDDNFFQSKIKDIFNLTSASDPQPAKKFQLEAVTTDIEGILPRNIIKVPTDTAQRLVFKLTVPENIAIKVPENVEVDSIDELNSVQVTALYSDGTTAQKNVSWNSSEVNWNKAGTYQISGVIQQEHYPFPFAEHRADPCISKWKGKYYFIATNDEDQNKTLYIREADSIPELAVAEEKLILDTNTYDHIKGLLWAPEIHIIEDDLYIFHAATTGEFFYEEAHVMKLKKGGSPTKAEDWSMPERVVKKDGSYLCEAGKVISLDMTVIHLNGEYYAAWSERQFLPVDLGAWIYIAKIDPKEPWKLTSDPMLLTKPDYGWANNHVFVDEGPFPLIKGDKLFLTYASALINETYCVGLLTAKLDADILNPASWTKSNYPLLTSRSVEGEYGPGHNSYVTDDTGQIWNTYHARPGVDAPRCTGLRRVHFDIDDYPVLDLTEERDLNQDLIHVTMRIIVR